MSEPRERPFAAEVRITPRRGILDPEGETIARALDNLGYEGVASVRAGRLIRIELTAADADAARERVERMCEELVANPLIEEYEVRVTPGEVPVGAAEGGPGAAGGDPDAAGGAR